MAGYYRRYIKDFANIAKPLHRLTERMSRFDWTNECQAAFEELRHRLSTAPVMAHPNFELQFILDTDASSTGLGAVLSQVGPDGKEQAIAYASHLLSKPEC